MYNIYCWCDFRAGGRKADLIVDWLKKKAGHSLATLNNVEEVKKFVDANKIAVVAFVQVRLVWNFID